MSCEKPTKLSDPNKKRFLEEFELLQVCLSEEPEQDWDGIYHQTTKMGEILTAIMYEEHHKKSSHMKEQTCPICEKPFMGWGNNPAPVAVDGNVCDGCNGALIIPIRFGNKRVEKFVMCILARNKSKK